MIARVLPVNWRYPVTGRRSGRATVTLGGGWELREGHDFVPPETAEAMEKRTNWGKLLTPAAQKPPTPEQQKRLIRAPDW